MNPATGLGRREFVNVWVPCMIVSYYPNVDRRHSKNEARRASWDVLVFWFDERRERLQRVYIHNDNYTLQKWKPAGW